MHTVLLVCGVICDMCRSMCVDACVVCFVRFWDGILFCLGWGLDG